jgi:hypothetical protein
MELKKIMSEDILKFEKLKEGKGCSSPPRECVVEWHVEFAGGSVRVSSGVLDGAGFDCYGCVPGVFPFAHFIIRADLASSFYILHSFRAELSVEIGVSRYRSFRAGLSAGRLFLLYPRCQKGSFSLFRYGKVPYSVSQRVTAEKIYESSEFPYSVRWKFREV